MLSTSQRTRGTSKFYIYPFDDQVYKSIEKIIDIPDIILMNKNLQYEDDITENTQGDI